MKKAFQIRETYASPECKSFTVCTQSCFLQGSVEIPAVTEEPGYWS